jgi:hypothetical protein
MPRSRLLTKRRSMRESGTVNASNVICQTFGPCKLCGDVDYPLSYEGPEVCPNCCTGLVPVAQNRRLREALKLLKAEMDKLRKAMS